MDHLDSLEAESIYVLREAYAKFDKLAILWSLGKDSNVVLWLTKKAFFGHVPLPVLHVDTGKKFKQMYDFRARYSEEWGLKLLVEPCPPIDQMDPSLPPAARSAARKTAGLNTALARHGFAGLIAGIRRDEEGTRAKERYFSPRDKNMEWNVEDQPPELWDQFKTDFEKGTHIRIHPLLHWTELNIWEYIERESIQVIPLYFANGKGERYRSLGCAPCTFPIKSNARTVRDIVEELRHTRTSERSGRAQDKESEDAFEKLRRDGYM